jgi:hypothetical protein
MFHIRLDYLTCHGQDHRIETIKVLRAITDMELKPAKQIVDRLAAGTAQYIRVEFLDALNELTDYIDWSREFPETKEDPDEQRQQAIVNFLRYSEDADSVTLRDTLTIIRAFTND